MSSRTNTNHIHNQNFITKKHLWNTKIYEVLQERRDAGMIFLKIRFVKVEAG